MALQLNVLDILLVSATALFSSLLGSVAGTGGAAVLLPVLVYYFGIQAAVPMVTLANLTANVTRVWVHRSEIDRRVVAWFVLGAVPLSLLGTWLFTRAEPGLLTRMLGAFMVGVVAWRRLRPHPPRPMTAAWFLPLGAGFGLLNGLVSGIGPLMAPFFLAYGLLRGAYIGTDALATVFMQGAKLVMFGATSFLTPSVLLHGALLIPFMFLGPVIGKRVLERLPDWVFAAILEVTLVLAGLDLLLRG